MFISIKRVYETAAESDGIRILVDRVWPRGLSKEKIEMEYWARNTAPSTKLRKWYQHDPAKWEEFKNRYFVELNANAEAVTELGEHLHGDKVTFLFGSRELELNNAAALREYAATYPDRFLSEN